MKAAIYMITREIAIFLSVVSSYKLFLQNYTVRAILNLILLCLFIFVSRLHQKRIAIPSTSYFFIFIVLFCVNSLSSCVCTIDAIENFNSQLKAGRWILNDYYILYFFVSLITYIVILFHLLSIKLPNYRESREEIAVSYISTAIPDIDNVYINGSVFLLLFYFIGGKHYEAVIPIFVYFAIVAIKKPKRRFLCCSILIALSLLFLRSIILSRFKLIEIVLPIILCLIILANSEKKINIVKTHIIFAIIIVVFIAYGIVSEIIKLNLGYGTSYSLASILSNEAQLSHWAERQLYRIFVIWIKLGGYIIYHTDLYGNYYGLTYVKSFLGLLGFETVSLPKISAKYNSSTYAQPGLLAEGYANFGFLGAVMNILSVYFLMLYFERNYYKKPSFERLLYVTVPFSQILLDGGTLNSALLLVIMCFIFNTIKVKFKLYNI